MLDKRPFFSVVIPTLNEEKYLPKLLKCLREQLDKDFEVIVVDGSSDDKTVERAEGVKIIASKKRNVSYQRNLGAKAARGKWLVFLDADVSIPANYLSEMHNTLILRKDCRFLTTWMRPDSKNKSEATMIMVANLLMEAANSLDKPLVGGFNIVILKKVFFEVGGFNEKWKPGMSEDHDLAWRAKEAGYSLYVLKAPKVEVSLRRFRREGTFGTLSKYAKSMLKLLTEGPFAEQMFDYPMGGKVGVKKKLNGLGRMWKSLTAEL